MLNKCPTDETRRKLTAEEVLASKPTPERRRILAELQAWVRTFVRFGAQFEPHADIR